VIQSITTGAPALNVGGSHNIVIVGVTLTGGSQGLRVARGSEVRTDGLTSQNNQGSGVVDLDHSVLRMANATLIHNGAAGIRIDSSTVTFEGNMIIGNNVGNGIDGAAARISLFDTAGANSIRNNGGIGIVLADGSRGHVIGNTTVQANSSFGVLVIHTSTLNLVNATVDGNGDTGIDVQETSHGELGHNTVTNNRSATLGGGIRVGENSDISIDGGMAISGNTGAGVQAELGGVLVSTGGNTITGSGADGVLVRRMGIARFFNADTINSLTCDNTALVIGNLSAVANVRCSKIEK